MKVSVYVVLKLYLEQWRRSSNDLVSLFLQFSAYSRTSSGIR